MKIKKHILIFAFLLLLFLLLISCGGESTKIYQAPSIQKAEDLAKLNKREKEALTTYKLLDAEHGIYRIPIDSAFSKLVNVKSYE